MNSGVFCSHCYDAGATQYACCFFKLFGRNPESFECKDSVPCCKCFRGVIEPTKS